MTPIEKLKKLLLEEFLTKHKQIVVEGLDLSDVNCDVIFENWTIRKLFSTRGLKAKVIIQDEQTADAIAQSSQHAKTIYQGNHQAKVIYQGKHQAEEVNNEATREPFITAG